MVKRNHGQLLSLVYVSLFACLPFSRTTQAQVVEVTMQFETNRLAAGAATLLRAYAQVVPARQNDVERIFSWYVDVLNLNASVARADFTRIQKPASDNDPLTSSSGTVASDRLTGVYDTFLNQSGAGVAAPVLLFSVPVTAVAPGRATFSIRAGTGVAALSADFIAAPIGGGEAFTGGDYSAAQATLEVGAASTNQPTIIAALKRPSPTTPDRLELSFTTVAGWNYFIESRDTLAPASLWQLVPGGPYNSGSVILTNVTASRFFRVKATSQ